MYNLRAAGKKITREKLIEKYQSLFAEKFDVQLNHSQFAFINNGVDQPEH